MLPTTAVLDGGRASLPREFGVFGRHLGCNAGWWSVGNEEAGQGCLMFCSAWDGSDDENCPTFVVT